MKLKRWWNQRRFGARLWLLVAAAAALMLLTEALCNYRALTTAGLTPVPLPLNSLTVETDLSYDQYPDGITVELGTYRSLDLIWPDVGIPLHTMKIDLSGEGVTYVAVFISDEASAASERQVYSVYCVASDPALRSCVATAESAGDAGVLRIRLKPQDDGVLTVTGVTLNAPVPFTWQWPRMALSFTGASGLLCALFLRGKSAAFNPNRRSHRLIVLLPLCAMMAFTLAVAHWIEPDTPLFSGVTDEQAAAGDDVYAVLYEAFRSGRLSVAKTPDTDLAALANPYDQSVRTTEGVGFSFDYAYYDGRYYVYYGPAPVLAIYAPYHALTGRVPTSRDATLLMGWLAILCAGWAACGLIRRYAPCANVYALSLGCVTAVAGAGIPLLVSSADFYYLAELSFVCFAAGAVAFGLHAATLWRRGLRRVSYALSGLCFALAAMSRPSALPMLIAVLLPLFLGDLAHKRARGPEAAAFLLPAVLGVGALLAYNAARFGSPFDFGWRYQLTVTDMHYGRVRLGELFQALYHYLLEPLEWNDRFPYLSVAYHASPAAGRYVFTLSNAGVLVFPVTWAVALYAPAAGRFPARTRALERERRRTLFWPLIVSLPMMLVSYGCAGAILRYTCDFRLFFTLAGVVCTVMLLSRADTPERKAIAAFCAGLCVLSLLIGVGMVFDNERDYIFKASPQVFYGLQRMFFPY